MRGVKAPDQGLIPISMMGAHLLTLFERLRSPSCIIEDLADLFPCFCHIGCFRVGLQDLDKNVNKAFCSSPEYVGADGRRRVVTG
jgi:hypothetical protein